MGFDLGLHPTIVSTVCLHSSYYKQYHLDRILHRRGPVDTPGIKHFSLVRDFNFILKVSRPHRR